MPAFLISLEIVLPLISAAEKKCLRSTKKRIKHIRFRHFRAKFLIFLLAVCVGWLDIAYTSLISMEKICTRRVAAKKAQRANWGLMCDASRYCYK